MSGTLKTTRAKQRRWNIGYAYQRKIQMTDYPKFLEEVASVFNESSPNNDNVVQAMRGAAAELRRLQKIEAAANELYSQSDEYHFDDGLGKGALQEYWDDLANALEKNDD